MDRSIQQRICDRRNEFGAEVAEMARWANLPPERWQAIEDGDSLSVAELSQVAKALAVDPGTFLRGEERNARRSVARFRKAADPIPGSRTLEIRTLALAAELGRIGGGLHQLLGKSLPLAEIRKTVPVSQNEEPWRQGYRLGAAARPSLGIPVGPIVDLRTTMEELGVHMATVPFSQPSVDAASLMEDGAMPIVLLNQSSPRIKPALPRRAAMAHELCHLLHDAGEQNFETRLSGEGPAFDDLLEQRARAFAPAFLAPPEEVRHWFRSGGGKHRSKAWSKVLALAERWGLSWAGAVWHAKNCDLIPAATAERLATESISPDWQVAFEPVEPQGVSRSSRVEMEISPLCEGRLSEIVLEALEAGAISRGRAREILTWG